jgi:hypothetical protein
MRTFNGLEIFTQQLNNTGQLDLRYTRITGNTSEVNLNAGVRVGAGSIPASQGSVGYSGQLAWNQSHLYICLSGNGISTGLWARISLENF